MIKKIIIAALAIPLAGHAQVLKTGGMKKITVPAETPSVAAFSPNGDFLLLTSPVYDGLVKYNIATGKTEKLTDAPGAGYGRATEKTLFIARIPTTKTISAMWLSIP